MFKLFQLLFIHLLLLKLIIFKLNYFSNMLGLLYCPLGFHPGLMNNRKSGDVKSHNLLVSVRVWLQFGGGKLEKTWALFRLFCLVFTIFSGLSFVICLTVGIC